MGIILFYIVLPFVLIVWEIELATRFACCYHATLRRSEDFLATRADFLLRLAHAMTGFRAEFVVPADLELPDPAVIICNHQSLLDIVLVSAGFPQHHLRFVAKRELAWGVPAISMILRMQRHALIDRTKNLSDGRRRIAALAHQSASQGFSPVIFPEGTRSRDGKVHSFHTGGLRTVQQITSLPMIVCALDGATKLVDIRNLVHLKNGRCRLTVLYTTPPPQSKQDTARQIEAAEKAIRDSIGCGHTSSGLTAQEAAAE